MKRKVLWAGVVVALSAATIVLWPEPLTDGERADEEAQRTVEWFRARPVIPTLETKLPPTTTPDAPVVEEPKITQPDEPVYDFIHGQVVAVISIPKIGITYPMKEGTDIPLLRTAIGHYDDTAGPGQTGNFGTAAHSCCGDKSAPYQRLQEMRAGDGIIVETARMRFTYRVVETPAACGARTPLVVNERETGVLNPEPCQDKPGKRKLMTLTTCTPVQAAPTADRLIVWAELTGEEWK